MERFLVNIAMAMQPAGSATSSLHLSVLYIITEAKPITGAEAAWW